MARCPAGHESQASDYCDTCGLVIGAEPSAAAPAAQQAAVAAGSSAPASPGGAGGRCPVCEAERNGRFCEECGYDFELAEAMPQAVMTPGVAPMAEPEPQAAEPVVAESVGAEAAAGESAGEQEPGESQGPESQGAQSQSAQSQGAEPQGSGIDLDAELAQAEQALARTASGETSNTANANEAAVPSITPSSMLGDELSLQVDADREYYKAQVDRGDIVEDEFPFPKYPQERRFTFGEGPVRVGRASASRGLNPEIDLTGPPLDPAVSHLHAQLLRHDEGWVVVDMDSANGTRLNDAEEPLEPETEIPIKQGDRIHLGVWTTITVL